jgi:hypothetical protein
MTQAAFVYQLHAADWSPLYVGYSYNPTARIAQHLGKPWWHEVVHIQIERFTPYTVAMSEAKRLIGLLQPKYNVLGTDRQAPFGRLSEDCPADGCYTHSDQREADKCNAKMTARCGPGVVPSQAELRMVAAAAAISLEPAFGKWSA